MLVLIIGSEGQLGKCLYDKKFLSPLEIKFFNKKDLDITNFDKVCRLLKQLSPSYVINAAAYTNVDEAENEASKAFLINKYAVKNLAQACLLSNTKLIHFSTDYVFDGQSSTPYIENDLCNPKTVYGKSKLEGEIAIKESGCKFFIIRTSWVFSEYGNNFLKTMLNISKQKKLINVVNDQIGSPTYAGDIANATYKLISLDILKNIKPQILHFSGNTPCSWFDFAEEIFKCLEKTFSNNSVVIKPISSEDFQSKAKRPKYSLLNSYKIKKLIDIKESNWKKAIDVCIKKIHN